MSEGHDKLRVAVERHLPMTAKPLPDSTGRQSDGIALLIAAAWMRGAARYGRWDHDKEAAKLEDLEVAMDSLARLLAFTDSPTELQLSPAVRERLLAASGRDVKRLPLGPYGALRDALEALREGLSAAREAATEGEPKGKRLDRHYDALVVLEECERLWRQHTGVDPASTANNDSPGPFARFVADVFAALDIRVTPQGALKSLKHLRSE